MIQKKIFLLLLVCSIWFISSCKKVVDETIVVVINEVSSSNDFIEIYNASHIDADISGWSFYKNNELIYTIPEGCTITKESFGVLGCKGNTTFTSGLTLGSCQAGISGKKSLLLELRDATGERVDYFVNSAEESPRAADYWDVTPEQEFGSAGRFYPGEEGWFLLGGATPGRTNISAAKGNTFKHTVVDFSSITPNPTTIMGIKYVFDENAIPEITVNISIAEWNRLLAEYDQNPNNQEYVECDVDFVKNGEKTSVEKGAIRLRGNTSRRRPESSTTHKKDAADWHHVHFMLNLRKYVKDDAHTIRGVRKLVLKWFKDDPAYVREMYCYDLFRRFGIWTAINSNYCRLWIHVEGDSKPAYFGVYHMLENIDDEYLKERNDFGSSNQNLWKCRWGADLRTTDEWKFCIDDNSGDFHTYELKDNDENFNSAKTQLKDFITKCNSLKGDSFSTWIKSVTDVNLLLRTYAVNVAVGMWDDYWNNVNNYYIYFNGSGTVGYKFFFIPFDYDNTLGTTSNCGVQTDAGRHDPLNWGVSDAPLIAKMLTYPEFREIYISALKELANPDNNLFSPSASASRIKAWQNKISNYVSNDTGEDMKISDNTASWSSHTEYRLLSTGSNNFFQVKTGVINALK